MRDTKKLPHHRVLKVGRSLAAARVDENRYGHAASRRIRVDSSREVIARPTTPVAVIPAIRRCGIRKQTHSGIDHHRWLLQFRERNKSEHQAQRIGGEKLSRKQRVERPRNLSRRRRNQPRRTPTWVIATANVDNASVFSNLRPESRHAWHQISDVLEHRRPL